VSSLSLPLLLSLLTSSCCSSPHSPAGDELSWLAPNLGIWYGSLLMRDEQYQSWLKTGRPNSFWITGFFNPQGFVTAVQQEITRAHKHENWALDSVVIHAEVTEIENSDHVKSPPKVLCRPPLLCLSLLSSLSQEGVYLHGLYMDGAAWNTKEGSLTESLPKKLFASLPVMLVTAVTKAVKKSMTGDYGPYGGYDCPIYKYPVRTDRYLVFIAHLPSRDRRPLHWILRGVALLCTTN
jgi:dynein heavy chain, axonemal